MILWRYLVSWHGRTARPGMWVITILLALVGMVGASMREHGYDPLPADLLFAVLLYPAFLAVPVKRFHDMGRGWWWAIVFLAGMVVSFLFLMLDLTTTAGILGLSAFSALTDPDTYLEVLKSFNESTTGEPLKPIGAIGFGGISLGLIFGLIEFGWLHFVPGQHGDNEYGPRPGAAATR